MTVPPLALNAVTANSLTVIEAVWLGEHQHTVSVELAVRELVVVHDPYRHAVFSERLIGAHERPEHLPPRRAEIAPVRVATAFAEMDGGPPQRPCLVHVG